MNLHRRKGEAVIEYVLRNREIMREIEGIEKEDDVASDHHPVLERFK